MIELVSEFRSCLGEHTAVFSLIISPSFPDTYVVCDKTSCVISKKIVHTHFISVTNTTRAFETTPFRVECRDVGRQVGVHTQWRYLHVNLTFYRRFPDSDCSSGAEIWSKRSKCNLRNSHIVWTFVNNWNGINVSYFKANHLHVLVCERVGNGQMWDCTDRMSLKELCITKVFTWFTWPIAAWDGDHWQGTNEVTITERHHADFVPLRAHSCHLSIRPRLGGTRDTIVQFLYLMYPWGHHISPKILTRATPIVLPTAREPHCESSSSLLALCANH